MSLQGGYTDFKQIFLLSVSIQAHILWYPGPYNWLLFYFYEWYSKHNIVTRDSLTPDSFIMQNFYYLLWDFFFLSHYTALVAASTIVSHWVVLIAQAVVYPLCRGLVQGLRVENLLKYCFENLIPAGRLLHSSCEVLAVHSTPVPFRHCSPPPMYSLAQDMFLLLHWSSACSIL